MRWMKAGALALSGALGCGTTLTVVGDASAQVATGDLVVLTNGGRVRGVVTDYEPGVRVVVQLPDGTVRTYAGPEVASVSFAGATADATQAAQGTATQAVLEQPLTPSATPPARWSEPRDFALEVEAGPWTNATELPTHLPEGSVHVGAQLGAFGVLYFRDFGAPTFSGGGDLFAFADVRLGRFGSFRGGAVVSLAGATETYDYGYGRSWSTVTRSAGVGGRALFGHDLADTLVLRVGVDAETVLVRETFQVLEAVLRGELAAKLAGGHVELGGAISLGSSVAADTEYDQAARFMLMLPRVELFVSGVL